MEPKVSPANLSVFRNREPGLAGITKWNTVITAKNKVTQIPVNIKSKEVITEETKGDAEEEKEEDEPKLPCDFCSKVFSGKRNLRRHKHRKHQNSSKTTKGDISIVKVEHSEDGSSEFQCNQCHLEFKSERKLVKHNMQHSNRFSCDGCDKSFQSSSTLKNHRNIHLDEKPFKCEVCNKEFTQAGNLKTHRIRHHNESDTTQLDSSAITVTPVDLETDVVLETDIVLESIENDVNDDTSENVTVDHCGYCDELFDDTAEQQDIDKEDVDNVATNIVKQVQESGADIVSILGEEKIEELINEYLETVESHPNKEKIKMRRTMDLILQEVMGSISKESSDNKKRTEN